MIISSGIQNNIIRDSDINSTNCFNVGITDEKD
jgi:hypothetical protein